MENYWLPKKYSEINNSADNPKIVNFHIVFMCFKMHLRTVEPLYNELFLGTVNVQCAIPNVGKVNFILPTIKVKELAVGSY